ncbi:hypothetical protein AHAS_Ahas09G0073400 [Arachis hypogaea]
MLIKHGKIFKKFFFLNFQDPNQTTESKIKDNQKTGLLAIEYLKQIQTVVDSLMEIGYVFITDEHIEVIFEGLTEDYTLFLSSVMAKSETIIIFKVESLLLGHENMIERFRKSDL